MTKKILSLLLVVAMLATLSVGMFTASAEDAAAGTAFADDWSKWTINGKHNVKGEQYGITDASDGYALIYNATWAGRTFTYSDKVDLGDRFDYSFKMLTRGDWGPGSDPDSAIAYTATLGDLTLRISLRDDHNRHIAIEAAYAGKTLFVSDSLVSATDDKLFAAAKAALTAAKAQNADWYTNRMFNINVTFDNGVLKIFDMNNGGKVCGQTIVSNYDFTGSTVSIKSDNGKNFWNLAAFCDIKGTKYESDTFNLPYTVSNKNYPLDFTKFTSTEGSVVTTKAANGYDALANHDGGSKNNSAFDYGDLLDLGNDFEVKYTMALETWNYTCDIDAYASIGALKISLVHDGTTSGRNVKLVITYGEKKYESGEWAEGYNPGLPEAVKNAVTGDIGNAGRIYAVKVVFNDGEVTASCGSKSVSCAITNYDFAKAKLSFGLTQSESSIFRRAYYDISATAKNIKQYNYVSNSFGSFAADKITAEGRNHDMGSVKAEKTGDILYSGRPTDESTVVGTLTRDGAAVNVDRFTLDNAVDLSSGFNASFNYNYSYTGGSGSATTFIFGDVKVDIACVSAGGNSYQRVITVYDGDKVVAGPTTVGFTAQRDTDKDETYKDMAAALGKVNSETSWWYTNKNWYLAMKIAYANGALTVSCLQGSNTQTIYSGVISSDLSNATPTIEVWTGTDGIATTISEWSGTYNTLPTIEELNPDKTESDFYTDWVDFDDNYSRRINKATKDVQTKATAKVAAASATLSDSIAMNFKLVGDFDKYYSDIKAANSGNDVSVVKSGDNWVASVTGLGAKDMAKDVVINFTAVDKISGQPVAFSQAISVADYAKGVYAMSTTSAADKAVIAYMLNYGAAAQTYFGVTDESVAPDATIAASLTLANAVTADNYAEQLTKVQEVLNSDALSWTGASLVLEDKISVKVYFTGNADGLTATVDGAAAAFTKGDGYVEIKLNPNQLEKTIVVTVGDAKLTYSAATYAYNKLGGSNENLKALVIAAVNYGRACAAK